MLRSSRRGDGAGRHSFRALLVIAIVVGGGALASMSSGQTTLKPGTAPTDTVAATTFELEVAGGGQTMFNELVSVRSEVETVEYMEAGEKGPEFGRALGRAKPAQITLRRPMVHGRFIQTWHAAARTGDATAFRDTKLIFKDAEGVTVVTYMLVNAFPSAYDFRAKGPGGSLTETVTLTGDEVVGM